MRPQARHDKLLVQEIGDEVVVYDQARDRAHCLNRTSAIVWRHCDGRTTVAELATLLPRGLNLPVEEELVWLALDQLEKKHLLQERVTRPLRPTNSSRRHLLKKLGQVGAVALMVPAISSIVAPTPAIAQYGLCFNSFSTGCNGSCPPAVNGTSALSCVAATREDGSSTCHCA